MNKNLYHQLSERIEREWDVGGLADGIENGFYERFAYEVATIYCAPLEAVAEAVRAFKDTNWGFASADNGLGEAFKKWGNVLTALVDLDDARSSA